LKGFLNYNCFLCCLTTPDSCGAEGTVLFWRERFLLVRFVVAKKPYFLVLTSVACGFPPEPWPYLSLFCGNKVNKVCDGVWRSATEVEEKENKVFFGADGSPMGIPSVLLVLSWWVWITCSVVVCFTTPASFIFYLLTINFCADFSHPRQKKSRAGPSDKPCRVNLLFSTSNSKTQSDPLCRPPHNSYAGISP